MSFWCYCGKCSAELDAPTPREVVNGGIECPHCGYSKNDPLKTVGELVLEQQEEIRDLREKYELLRIDLDTVINSSYDISVHRD